MDTPILLLGVLSSSVGFGYFWYGRKQKAPVPLVCGLLLMVVPYFVPGAVALFLLGTVLGIIPGVLRI
ncbi:amino acid transport protein [Pseudoxanthomonas sp. NC8]|nr:amino acid transport protein [Pseudoxanthomonas sp. NC8]